MGVWALFLVITGMFEITKIALLKNAHIKFVTSTNDPTDRSRIASSSLVINATMSLLFILLVLFFADQISYWLNTGEELADMLIWFTPGVVLMIFFTHMEAVQQSHLDFKGVFAGYFVRQVLFFALIIFHTLADIHISMIDLAVYQSLSILFGTLILYAFTRKYLSFRFNPNMVCVRKILGFGGYVFGSGLTSTLYQNVDQLMVAKFIGTSTGSVADYNAAQRINTLVEVPSYAASEVLFPKASRASAEEGPTRIKYYYERMVAIIISFTIPVALFIIVFPAFILHIIAGPEYMNAVPILQLYMIACMLRPAQNQAANLLNSIGKPRLCFLINLGYLGVNIILNYIFLKEFGFYGPAMGSLLTFIIGAFVWYFIMRREIGVQVSGVLEQAVDVYKSCGRVVAGLFSKKQSIL